MAKKALWCVRTLVSITIHFNDKNTRYFINISTIRALLHGSNGRSTDDVTRLEVGALHPVKIK